MTEEIIDLIDCPAIEYIAVGNQYFCKVNDCDCNKISTCGYKRLEQENFALTQESQQKSQTICELEQENKQMKSALEEIKHGIMHIPPFDKQSAQMIEALLKLIDEVLNESN